MEREAETRTDALALELHGDQDQGRAVGVDAFLGLPVQEAEAKEEDVGAAFLESKARTAEKIG